MISEASLGNLIYLTLDIYKIKNGISILSTFIDACQIASLGKEKIKEALSSEFRDKEDALQYYAARVNEAEYFITRNVKDFKKYQQSDLPIFTPNVFLEHWDSK